MSTMVHSSKIVIHRSTVILILLSLLAACTSADPFERAYKTLTNLRDKKEEQLNEYFAYVREQVESVHDDQILLEAFGDLRALYHGQTIGRDIEEIETAVQSRYVADYHLFYDIHFIDGQGDVFYSLRKQDNLFRNIFSPDLADWGLSRSLKENPELAAVDFQFIDFTPEPSAFFAEPLGRSVSPRGWIVFQFTSSRLDDIFGREAELGQTGEVFLVNEDHFMLTDSYNLPTESVLRRHLSAQNIESKFAEREGTKVVIDYRGYEALTSFKVCEILGLRWLLIAKIDKAEVATAEYLAHESRYYPQLREAVRTSAPQYTSAVPPDPDRVVGLDDVQRVSGSQVLFTPGVSTCTAVILTLPGRFAYMAHVSPYDRIYGGSRTDLVSSVMKRVKDFEVADKELRNLEVVVVTPQIRYSQSIVKQLAESGIFLSQIRFLKNPEAACADVFFDQGSNETYVVWCFGDRYERTEVQLASTARDLGKLFLSL